MFRRRSRFRECLYESQSKNTYTHTWLVICSIERRTAFSSLSRLGLITSLLDQVARVADISYTEVLHTQLARHTFTVKFRFRYSADTHRAFCGVRFAYFDTALAAIVFISFNTILVSRLPTLSLAPCWFSSSLLVISISLYARYFEGKFHLFFESDFRGIAFLVSLGFIWVFSSSRYIFIDIILFSLYMELIY